MSRISWKAAKWILLFAVLVVITAAMPVLVAQPSGERYPAPRFPGLPGDPTSVDQAMPFARRVAANPAGDFGQGLGTSRAGETIVIIPQGSDNPYVLEALRLALVERKVTPRFIQLTENRVAEWNYAEALKSPRPKPAPRQGAPAVREGYTEVRGWFGSFTRPHAPQAWLKKTRPDLYDVLFAKNDPEYTPTERTIQYGRWEGGTELRGYLQKHPEVDGVYWGGSWIYLQAALGDFRDKWRGSAIFDRWRVMSDVGSYPGDVWVLSETKNLESLAYVDAARVSDPEGTNLSLDVSPELAQRWAKGAYERGHNMLGPNMATGRWARNAVSYPVLDNEWIPRAPLALWNGVVAATTNHVGLFPKMEVHYKNGFVQNVVGGGHYGELMRTFLKYPNINTVAYPYQDKPGYFLLQELALGTNPKVFRAPTSQDEPLNVITERTRAGYMHLGVGAQMEGDPTVKGPSPTWQAFTEKYELPYYHGYHMHIYFPTYQVRIRHTDKWIPIVERGRVNSLDNVEVRALASRYGNPDQILADAWVPEIPGINASGRYDDYARDPNKYHREQNDKIYLGTYEHITRATR